VCQEGPQKCTISDNVLKQSINTPDKQNGSTTIYDEMNRQVIDPILAMVFYAFHLYVIYKQFISQFVINIDGNLFGLCKSRDVGQHY
jgi:ABC-type histidine transport system ATPase subunit